MEAIELIPAGPQAAPAILFAAFLVGTFVSEDAACVAAGTAAANGLISFPAALLACFLGIFVGDMMLYGVGRLSGERAFNNNLVRRFVTDRSREKASAWLRQNGASAVFFSRFVTGLRLPTYLAAGALGTDLKKFTGYFLFASLIWTPVLVGSAAFSLQLGGAYAVVGIILLFMTIRVLIRYSSWQNRRRLLGRVRRVWTWEFWPIQVFYAPVVFYVLLLAIRYRSFTLFTAANPAFPAGGFKGESKSRIYDLLSQSPENSAFLLAHTKLNRSEPVGVRLRSARAFMEEKGLGFPVAVKPDAGERGKGVKIVMSYDELTTAVNGTDVDLILQEFAPGIEVSVFYYRRPSEEHGSIFSITGKRFPCVIGDGVHTVEELILLDQRAVCLADTYAQQLGPRDSEVPALGEQVQLIEIGTHSRGAIFLDGAGMKTDRLERAIDRICRGVDGFYFGRFDIRAGSVAHLSQGRNFKIVELNGVTSESTNIYDPAYSLFDAYRILFRQWKLAFEIGAENADRGTRTTGFGELMRLAFGRNGCCERLA